MSSYVQLQREVVTLAQAYVTDQRVWNIMHAQQIADLDSPDSREKVFDQLAGGVQRAIENHLNARQHGTPSQRGFVPRNFTSLYWSVITAKLDDIRSRAI